MIIGFYGPSNSGKTQIIKRLVEYFKEKNYKIIVIKHIGDLHKIDTEGKDTAIFSDAGAILSIGISETETAIFTKITDIDILLDYLNKIFENPIIFIEGFKHKENIRKIKISGEEKYPNTILESNDFDEIKNFIEREIKIEELEKLLPNLNCGDCGYENCRIMAENIYSGKNKLEDCKHINDDKIKIFVNEKRIYLNSFMQELIENTLKGMLSSLKGVSEIKNFKIFYK